MFDIFHNVKKKSNNAQNKILKHTLKKKADHMKMRLFFPHPPHQGVNLELIPQ